MLSQLSYSPKTAYITSHFRKGRPQARLAEVGFLATEDGRPLATEAGSVFAIGGIERPSWLPTLQDLKDALKISATDEAEDRHLERLIDQAIDLVAFECGIDAEPVDYVGLVEPDMDGYDLIKIDRSLINEVSSVDARMNPDYEWEPVGFLVRWENGIAYVTRDDEGMFDEDMEVKVEYSRGLTSSSTENRLFNAAVVATAVSLHDNPARNDTKTIMRNPLYSALKDRLKDRRSETKWTA